MQLHKVVEFLEDTPMKQISEDHTQGMFYCPWCDYEGTKKPHLSIKLEVEENEPMWYNCFRASCGKKGILTTDVLKLMGCIDSATLMELAAHNERINPSLEKKFNVREARDYVLVNLPTGNNQEKLDYVRRRLGVNLTFEQLKDLKIQLSLLDMLRVNDIRKLSTKTGRLNMLDVYCIGFVSMFNDFLIARDITPDLKTGDRYFNYRISGKADSKDLKIYSIPRTIDLLDPHSAIINVAEGPFSILGAYLNTDLGANKPNSVWIANCGAQYESSIIRVCKQYGLLKVWINIWSDSEIKLAIYYKLRDKLKSRLDIRRFNVLYNEKAEDFGQPKNRIKVNLISL